MAENISEALFQAMDTIIGKRLESINFDNTDIYSITDASKADLGEYKVTDGSVVFTAYSKDTSYKEDDAVYVTIPNNDFNQQKLIIGKYTNESEKPFTFISPFDTIIDVTGNIIDGQIDEGGLTANAINNETNEGVVISGPNEEKVLLWKKDCTNQNYVGFERLGIRGDFKSWLDSFDCVEGHYGLELELLCRGESSYTNSTIYEQVRDRILKDTEEDWEWVLNSSGIAKEIEPPITKQQVLNYINTKLTESCSEYILRLDTDDMVGNPYNFLDYFQQEQVFDISEFGQILSMRLYFYQDKGTFKDIMGVAVPHTDDFNGFLLPHNLFTIDPYITLGYDLDNFKGEQVLLTCTDSTTYKQIDVFDDAMDKENDRYNKKIIHLSWIHKQSDGSIISINQDTEIEGKYRIRWYKHSIGAPSPDGYAGVDWKLEETGDKQFTYTLVIDENSYNKDAEFVKAIVFYEDTAGHSIAIASNVLEFDNEANVLSDAEIDQSRGLSFNFLDNTNGIYYIYKQNYSLIDENQSTVNRRLQCELYSEEQTVEGPLTAAKSITWRIPANNTMIHITNFDYSGVNLKYTQAEILKKYGKNSVSELSDTQKTEIGKSKAPEYYADILYSTHKDNIINTYTDYLTVDGIKAPYGNKTTGLLYDDENQEIVITWYGNENNAYSINSILDYTIDSTYSQNNTNNNITCVVNINNREYVGTAGLRFGVGGTNGTAYTLVIQAFNEANGQSQEDPALTANINMPKRKKVFKANIYTTTPKATKVDIFNNENFSKLKFEWKLGDSNLIKCYTNIGSSYTFAPKNTSSLLIGAQQANNNNYNLKINNSYYMNPTPNEIVLDYNASINDLLYLQLTLKGWGDYDLVTVLPIPIRSNTIDFNGGEEGYTYQVSHINGPREVMYPTDGYPEWTNNPYTLYVAEYESSTGLLADNDIQVNSAIWKIYNPFNPFDGYTDEQISDIIAKCENAFIEHPDIYNTNSLTEDGQYIYQNIVGVALKESNSLNWLPRFADYDGEGRFLGFNLRKIINAVLAAIKDYYIGSLTDNNTLEPLNFYMSDATGYGVQATYGTNVVWTQPIWTYINAYSSATLNQWNGKSLQIDEEEGTIVARGLAAGKKENDNSFTGVVIGDWSTAGGGNSSDAITNNTGVYGFEHGAMAYAFKDDGTAFIGKSGKGRILFDGNESTITSENFNSLGMGLEMDLDDGVLQFKNKKHNALNGVDNSEATITDYFITLDASNDNLNYDDAALSIGTNTPNFYVQWDGSIYAKNGHFEGHITGSTIEIGGGLFKVDENGKVNANDIDGYHAYFENLDVDTLSILNEVESNVLFSGDVTFGAKVYGGDYINATLHDPSIHIYLGSQGQTMTKKKKVYLTRWTDKVRSLYLYVSKSTTSGRSITSAIGTNITEGLFNTYIQREFSIYYYNTESVTSGAVDGNVIHIHKDQYSSGEEIGQIGFTGVSTTYPNNPTVGFKMSKDNYGVSLQADAGGTTGGLLTLGGGSTGNFWVQAGSSGSSMLLTSANTQHSSFNGKYHDIIIKGCQGKWALRFPTNGDAPYINYNDGTQLYDLRYAYFA